MKHNMLKRTIILTIVMLSMNGFSSDTLSLGTSVKKCEDIPMYSISPFYTNEKGDNHALGLEWNKWKSHHPSNKGCNPIYGYGIKASVGSSGFFLSPYGLFSVTDIIEVIGLSAGPEVGINKQNFIYGVSARAWISFVGMQVSYMRIEGVKYGLYVFLPLHMVMLQ